VDLSTLKHNLIHLK